jgi:hypothetical protein
VFAVTFHVRINASLNHFGRHFDLRDARFGFRPVTLGKVYHDSAKLSTHFPAVLPAAFIRIADVIYIARFAGSSNYFLVP